jgi:hypothetical protein
MPEVTDEAVEKALTEYYSRAGFAPANFKSVLHADMRRVLEQFAASAPAVSGEWVMVPREPTQAMIDAGYYPCVQHRGAKSVWGEMIAAAPAPSAVEEAVEAEREANAKIADDTIWLRDDEATEYGKGSNKAARAIAAAIRARKP